MRNRVIVLLIGALAFWVPVALLESLSRGRYSIIAINALPVACTLLAYWLLRQRFEGLNTLALRMLAGIYLLGPLSISVAASAFSGGFTRMTGAQDTLWLLLGSIVPPLMLMMAGYNGTIFGLTAVTIMFVLITIRKRQFLEGRGQPDIEKLPRSRPKPR